jgi:hypothetical protein
MGSASPESRRSVRPSAERECIAIGRATTSGPDFGLPDMAQNLDLERKQDGLVAKFSVLGFQSIEQIPIVTPFSTPKLENGGGFPAVR